MALGKPGRLRVDQPTITGELGLATDAYTPSFARDDCSFVERLQAGALLMKVGLFFGRAARLESSGQSSKLGRRWGDCASPSGSIDASPACEARVWLLQKAFAIAVLEIRD